MIDVLKQIMWRTCKSTVNDELGIPPQTEIVHNIIMSDLQSFFYNTQHTQCGVAFREKALKMTQGYYNRNDTLAKMSTQTLNSVCIPFLIIFQYVKHFN